MPARASHLYIHFTNMKKIFGFLTLALATTALFSCSDDDNNSNTTADGVQIVTRPSEIAPAGGESAIEVNKPVASVYATNAWLNVTAEGNTVKLSADANSSVESRHSNVVIKASENDSTVVSVSQLGLVFHYEDGDVSMGNNGGKFAKFVKHNEPMEIERMPEWASATVDGDSIRVDVSANTTGNARGGYVVFKSSAMKDSILISQADFSQLKGDYYFGGYDLTTGQEGYTDAKLYTKNRMYYVQLTNLKWSFDCLYDDKNMTLTTYNATWVGTMNNQYYIASMLLSDQGTISADDKITGQFTFNVLDDGTIIAVLGGQYDEDSKVAGMAFAACTKQNLSTYQGISAGFSPCLLLRLPPNADAETQAKAKARASKMMKRMGANKNPMYQMPSILKWK